MIDQPNPTTSLDLCARCTRAENAGDLAAALDYARRAWDVAADALERCASAHFIARCLPDPTEQLRWHRIALNEAEAAAPESVATWLPSLYVNLGRAHEALGEMTEAQTFYARQRLSGWRTPPMARMSCTRPTGRPVQAAPGHGIVCGPRSGSMRVKPDGVVVGNRANQEAR